jgi:outer membrane protein OmpA-like peptidoglycan-associated protein
MNILKFLMEQFSPELISKLGSTIGENTENTQKALTSAVPSILGGLMNTASSSNGVSSIESIMKMAISSEVGVNFMSMLESNEETSKVNSMGTNMLTNLFGNKVEAVSNSIASSSGIQVSSASTLIGMITPYIMGKLGAQANSTSIGVNGLMSLLSSQKESILGMMPSRFAGALGLENLSTLGDGIAGTTKNITSNINSNSKVDATINAGNNSIMKWILPLLLLLLAGTMLWYFLKGCNNNAGGNIGTDITNIAGTAKKDILNGGTDIANSIDNAGDSIKNKTTDAIDGLGAFFKRKLPNGIELNIPENGIENKLVKFVDDVNRPVDKTTWYTMDRILFETGKSTLKKESDEQINNIVEIMKAYPAMQLKIGGYTDNTGDAKVNLKLSEERATTVMNAIVKKGIDLARLKAEGYGQEHPVATNDTEEGRQENRRIDVRITKK